MCNRILYLYLALVAASAAAPQFNINDYGAIGDEATTNTPYVQRAIDAAHSAGGGTVVVPEGIYTIGTIQLKSHVTLHLEQGAMLKGVPDSSESHYPKISPGYESFLARPDLYPQKVLIYAINADDVAITGAGTINGNGMHPKLVFSRKERPKCINLIRFIKSTNVRIEGKSKDEMLLITNSGHWALQPMNCDGVHVQYVRIEEYGGSSPDALPISDCRDVLVEDCYLSSDDDSIGLKNGSPHITVKNITVKRTVCESTNTGYKGGSPQSFGPFENIKFIGCTFRALGHDLRTRDYGEHHGFCIAICNGGGSIDGVLIEDCMIDGTKLPFGIYIGNIRNGYWADWWPGKPSPESFGSIRNITVRNVSNKNPDQYPVLIEGRKGAEVENVFLENVYLKSRGGGTETPMPRQNDRSYPNLGGIYGKMPAYGFFVRNVKNLQMKNVWSWTLEADARPCLVTENVSGLDSRGLNQGQVPDNYVPAIAFDEVELGAASIIVSANARDHDGAIQQVTLYRNDTLVGVVTQAPYKWHLRDLGPGDHHLKLIAKDNEGAVSPIAKTVNLD